MLKKNIDYVDFNGNKRQKDFYFNLMESELAQMNFGTSGGLAQKIQNIIDAQDGPEIQRLFIEIMDASYGVKSDDGERFIKSPEILEAFKQTTAYSKLYMELSTDSDKAAAFIKAIIPESMREEVAKIQAEQNKPALEVVQ